MLSGGSFSSTSLTEVSSTVTVQLSLRLKSVSGSSVYVDGPPLTVAVWSPVEPQEIEYHAPVTLTSSLNVIVMFESRATSDASASGEVALTRGAWSESQKCTFEVFRGAVAAAVKSAAF